MADLVKKIESWSLNKSDAELLQTVKKQLTDRDTKINELSKNLSGDNIAPLHAAADSNSLELFELVLGTEGIDNNPEFFSKGQILGLKVVSYDYEEVKDFVVAGGILDYAVKSENRNIDIIRVILDKVDLQHWACISVDGHRIAASLYMAINSDRLDILELLLSYGDKYCELSSLNCMVLAIMMNKAKVFSKVLPKVLARINESTGDNKLSLLHKTVRYNRVKMLRQLVEAGSNVNVLDVNGFTPLIAACAIAGPNNCGEGCYDLIISEILGAKSVDLHVSIRLSEFENFKAIDFLNERTCSHVKKVVDQAYTRDSYRKKLERRREMKAHDSPTVSTKRAEGLSSVPSKEDTNSECKDENKICWFCSAEPGKVALYKCKGCRVAWYCGEKCQQEDWSVHGPWCDRMWEKRKGKRKVKKEEPEKGMSAVFYELD